ncbi:unnamed protein product, partial [Staurois parvus]
MIGADPCSNNCRFSAREESTANNWQLSEDSALMISATHQCRPPVPSSAAQKCPAMLPTCAQQCH